MSIVQRLKDTYDKLDLESIDSGLLSELYHDRILFIDPLHRIEGLAELEEYFRGLYRNVTGIAFRYQNTWVDSGEAVLRWEMEFRHPKLERGRAITVPGMTHIQYADRVTRHQDYFDSNQLIFDHVPVLGTVLGSLKNRLK